MNDSVATLQNIMSLIKKNEFALAGVAQWIECWPVDPGVAGSIPSQGTCLGCQQGPQ